MNVSKRFRWEGAHRLPWHEDGCQNLHGHSYEMWVELTGSRDERGMVIDFKDIKNIIKPLVDAWDHAILVAYDDEKLLSAIELLGSKHYVLPYDSTSENLCQYVADHMGRNALKTLVELGISAIRIKLQETETCFAKLEVPVSDFLTNGSIAKTASLSENH